MVKVFDVLFLAGGTLMFVFARWTADQRASAHFSTTQLEATDAGTRRRVKWFKAAVVILNVAVGGAIAVLSAINLFG